VKIHAAGAGCFEDFLPAVIRIDRLFLALHERHPAVSQVCEMFNRETSGQLMV
jgi:hypothetical protein